jgi:WD40 repeat protein
MDTRMTVMNWRWLLMLGLILNLTTAPARLEAKAQPTTSDLYGDPLPPGVVARLGTVQLRAVGALTAFSSDGKSIVAVTAGRQVKLWDAKTGALCQQRELPMPFLDQTFLSPNGRLLAAREAGDRVVIDIWDIQTGKSIHCLQPPRGQQIYRARFASNGEALAVSEIGAKDVIRLWDMKSGEQRELSGHRYTFDSLAFSPDGKRLAASDGHTVLCWNVAAAARLWQAKGAFNISLGFSADGRTLLASPGHEERQWHAWDAATGKPAKGVKLPEGYNYAQFTVAPDSRTLVFVAPRMGQHSDGRIRLWDLHEGKLLHTLPCEGGIGPFAPDGKSFVTNDGALQCWELATGKPLLPDTYKHGHRSEVVRVVYSPDGRRLVSVGDGTVRLWNIAAAKPLHILRRRNANDAAFAPDAKHLVTGGDDGQLCVWDTESGEAIRRIPLHDAKEKEKMQNIHRLHVSPDGQTVMAISYALNGSVYGADEFLSRWELASGKRKSRIKLTSSGGLSCGFSSDGRTLATGGAVLLDTTTGKARMKLKGVYGDISHYAVSPDGRVVAAHLTRTMDEGTRVSTKMEGIQIWDAATGRALRLLSTNWVGFLSFSPDGRYLAAADLRELRLWELATTKVVLRHKAHEKRRGNFGESFASCLAYAPDGRTLATGHPDSTVLIWNLVPSVRPATAEDLPRLWDDLIGSDAGRAYAASWRLAEVPKEATSFLRERLRPAIAATAEQTRPLLADLDSDDFQKREAASARLLELGDRAEKNLKEALKARPSLEMRRRLENLLRTLAEAPSGETLRALRAMAVLERIDTSEARQVLKSLAQGMPQARVTREAKATLERLASYPTKKH